MPTQAVAASKALATKTRRKKGACKPRANCLKPKEIRLYGFDLPCALNYLKVKTSPQAGRRQDMTHDA
jgi:hypothetical protein